MLHRVNRAAQARHRAAGGGKSPDSGAQQNVEPNRKIGYL
jgi:hypothetical protein